MLLLLAYLALINIVAYTAFAFDKTAAREDRRHIPERTLLLLAAIGGSVGAITAQQFLATRPGRSRSAGSCS